MAHVFQNDQRGFSMIEVLIAVLILAIGLLGVAALQMASMNSGQEGYFRTQATAIAEDLASRIRAGRQAALKIRDVASTQLWVNGDRTEAVETYLNQFVTSPYLCAAPPDKYCRPDEVAGKDGELCTIAELATFETYDICNLATKLLPGGEVRVAKANDSLRISIAVGWDATVARQDNNEEAVFVNPVCQSAEFGFATTKDCVVVESIP